jgi:hypothetical protein
MTKLILRQFMNGHLDIRRHDKIIFYRLSEPPGLR